MGKTKVVSAKDVKKSFDLGSNVIEVIRGVSFDILSGEYIIFYGPSGCGKSTLLNLIAGLEKPTEGKVKIRDLDLSKLDDNEIAEFHQEKIGIVFQQFNLLKTMTVQENVALPLIAADEPRERALKRAANLLKIFGLGKHLKKIPTELSGGQQQRVAMSRALASNPWILICDEPTGNLDSKSSEDVMSIFYHLNRQSKRTILMVTHNPEHLKYATRVFHVKDGQIVKTQKNSKRPKLKKAEDFNLSSRSLEQTS